MINDVLSSNDHFLCTGWQTVPALACHIMYTLFATVDTKIYPYSIMFTEKYIFTASCLQKLAPLCPLLIITQMPLRNSLRNSLRKCHYANHYSSLLKCQFHYASLLRHYAKGTFLMTVKYGSVDCSVSESSSGITGMTPDWDIPASRISQDNSG